MKFVALIVGLAAVTLFLLSYQQKKRKNIIIFNATSRILYIVQYILLGAFEGAALDVLGTVSSVAAQNKDKGFIARHTKLVLLLMNLALLGAGLATYKNIFSLFPVVGVMLHTSAFWINDEKTIRIVSFLGSPFWLVYNLVSCAYGSAVGDVLSMVSIGIAFFRYDVKRKKDFDTYLFDFDGTLVDSMPSYVSVMLRILDENNISYEKDIVKIITPLGYAGTAEYFMNMGLEMPKEQIVSLMNEYAYEQYANNIMAKNNVAETLKKLKKRGASLNVLTASPHTVLDVCLKRIGIYDLFDNVWSCDDFETTKANPEIYKMAAKRIGVPVETVLFLDDNYNADKTAKTAGAKVCGVFDKSSEDYMEEMKKICDYYINDFSELENIKMK